jgi:DNA-binding Lrp family transcriptional regulator
MNRDDSGSAPSLFPSVSRTSSLTDIQSKVLAAAHLNGDSTISEIAQWAGVSESATRVTMRSFIQSGLITRRTYINRTLLGDSRYAFFFSLSNAGLAQKSNLLDFLGTHPAVIYLAEVGGRYQLKAHITFSSLSAHSAFFDTLADRFPNLVDQKSLLTLKTTADFPLQALGNCGGGRNWLIIEVSDRKVEIDDIDFRILRQLSDVGALSNPMVARKLGMAVSTFEYRVKRLVKEGVIVGSKYLIDTARLGYSTYLILLDLRSIGVEVRTKIFEYCRCHPNIFYCIECIGGWDFEIAAAVRFPAEIIELQENLQKHLGNTLVGTTTLPVLKFHKVSSYPDGNDGAETRGAKRS